MDFRGFFRPSAEAVQPRNVFANAVQGVLMTAVFAALAFLNDAGPLMIGLVVANIAVLSFLILDKATNKSGARIMVSFLIVAGLGLLSWSVWDKRQTSEQYKLSFDGMTVLRGGETLPTGERRVTSINTVIDVGNANRFPVYYKIIRQYGKTPNGSSNLRNPGASIQTLEPGHAIYAGSDAIEGVLANGKYHTAQVDFEIHYGRTQKMEKRFRYTADWQFFLCPVSALLCGDVTATNDELTNEWIKPS